MSYKSFKEYFQRCPLQRCSSASKDEPLLSQNRISNSRLSSLAEADDEERKPPKTSLKEKIGALVASGPNRDQNKVAPSQSRTTATALPQVPPESNLEEGTGCGKKRLVFEISNEKWAEDDCERRLDESRIDAAGALSRTHLSDKRRKHEQYPESSDEFHKKNCCTTSIEEDDEGEGVTRAPPLEPGEDEDLGLYIEAGLRTQPLPKGPFEPLQLWPPAGEGTSDGVDEESVVQVPASINFRLLEHQREGVAFLYELYRNDSGGVLGDDMGLGKTIQTIAFLAAILRKDSCRNESLLSSMSTKVGLQKCEKVVLIICPTSVVHNWAQEFRVWGDFDVGVCHGLQRETVLARVAAREVEVVLTSLDTFRIYGDEFCKIPWDCVVVDEAHRLKNNKSKLYMMCLKLPTKKRYGLTGTVMQNKYMELFNVFDWAAPGCLGTRDHFREYYAGPIAEGQRISAPRRFVTIAEDRRKHLFVVLQKYLRRKTKSETIGHLMKGKEDNVVFCPMSSVQQRVYRRVLESPDYQALKTKDLPCSCGSPLTRAQCCYRIVPNGVLWPALHKDSPDSGRECCPYCLVLPCVTKLRLLSSHLELIKPNPNDDPEKQEKDYKFARMAFGEDAGIIGGIEQEQGFMGLSDSQHCGKMAALEILLGSWIKRGDKVLLFSDSVRMLDILEKFLIRKAYCFSRLDGSIPMNSRQALVEDFNHSPSKQIFLISTRAGGLGLNLTSANRVVIFDPNWNPAHDLQAQDRSFRFGQDRHVTVFRLLAAGTLEELIYTRQIYKQQLFNIAMAGAPEKRYFEGVQGSKHHKGELFGLSNLFRDLSENVFAEDIIENHEERLIRIQKLAALEDETSPVEHSGAEDPENEIDHSGYVTSDETNSEQCAGCPQVATEGQDQGDAEEERRRTQKDLFQAGVLYSHRNEDVVNLGPPVLNLRKGKRKKESETRPKRQEKNGKADLSPGKQIRSVRQAHKSRRREDKETCTDAGPSISTEPKKQVPGEGKRAHFEKLAKFKGMELKEFGKWCISATSEEKTQLQLDYNNSVPWRPS